MWGGLRSRVIQRSKTGVLMLSVCVALLGGVWLVNAQDAEPTVSTPPEQGPSATGEEVSPAQLPTQPPCPEPAGLREIPRPAPGAPGDLEELKRRANEEAQSTRTTIPHDEEEQRGP